MLKALLHREITAEELVRRCLARIEEREPAVQAWEVVDAEGALRGARRIDALAERPPLCGLPVGVKDIIDTEALPTAYGSPRYRGHRPARDAECVRRLREAGAVVLGKTVTTEFAVYSPGKTRNPHDAARTPGGSSSGSAAAVADGMVPIALGTQTAASVIRPASFCGVVGWKPRFGDVPLEGVRPIAPSLDTLGLFARDLDDVAPVLSALTGRALAAAQRQPRIALCRTEVWERAEPWVRSAVEQRAAREVTLPPGLVDAQIAIMGAEAAVSFRGETWSELSEKLRAFLEAGRACSPEQVRDAHALAAHGRQRLREIFAEVDAIVTVAAPGEAPGIETTGDPIFSRIWTLLGAPSASLPLLRGPSGLPAGVQVIAATDEMLLAAAAALY